MYAGEGNLEDDVCVLFSWLAQPVFRNKRSTDRTLYSCDIDREDPQRENKPLHCLIAHRTNTRDTRRRCSVCGGRYEEDEHEENMSSTSGAYVYNVTY